MPVMKYLRIALLLASLLPVIVFGFLLITRPHEATGGQKLIVLAICAGFALNFVYILYHPPLPRDKKSRLRQIVSLWLDAKERELRERVGKLTDSPNHG